MENNPDFVYLGIDNQKLITMLKRISTEDLNHYLADIEGCKELVLEGFAFRKENIKLIRFPSSSFIIIQYQKDDEFRIVHIIDQPEKLEEYFYLKFN